MKLHRRTFQLFWDVHAWASVVGALLLYVMFFAAAFALFYPQLDDWAEPVAVSAEDGPPRCSLFSNNCCAKSRCWLGRTSDSQSTIRHSP